MTSKKSPELNFKLVGNVNHNKKHSEIDADIKYGADLKDQNKQISVAASLDRALKSWSVASAAFKGQLIKGKVSILRMCSFIRSCIGTCLHIASTEEQFG